VLPLRLLVLQAQIQSSFLLAFRDNLFSGSRLPHR